MSTTTGGGRKRSNSVKETLNALEPTRTDHRVAPSSTSAASASAKGTKVVKLPWEATGRLSWLVSPSKTFQIIALTVVAWYALEHLTTDYAGPSNPVARLLFISHRLSPQLGETEDKYGKGWYDLTFLGFYIIVFSFLRQSITEFLIRPFAKKLGLKTESKQARFMEQAYAVVYFSCSGAFGLVSLVSFSGARSPRPRTDQDMFGSTSCRSNRLGGTRLSICGWNILTGEPRVPIPFSNIPQR